MVSRKKKTWIYSPPRKPKPKVPEEIKQALQEKGDEIVEKIFKPEYLVPVPDQLIINHLVDFYTKWYRNYGCLP